jgi:hypothetical protein
LALLVVFAALSGYALWSESFQESLYQPKAITITSLTQDGAALTVCFDVVERGKMFDCPEVKIDRYKDRIDLRFVRKSIINEKTSMSSIAVSNPERLPVYVSNGRDAIRVWPTEDRPRN